ncbi:hypothetical protein PhiCh1p16 [Natrialba phage PhiCh1]|uniref:Virus protein phiCh1-VP15 n=2 Tax=root TaxID=1 RepID=D3T2G3_NATMM|nr:hypothetical protein [Natrialba magadii]NP_665933.1 hypothetical protein PhiCh1p16 [Natrialba phage PhiCh1]YP_010078045.1 uncharacterized protein KMC42_gp15 [Natrialba phage PhiCh1]AAM88689.1 unknown [Natrialba phage PhiCh1]ADD07772.1 virus protein phiCh1-VP15 [Natrialba magadii ATCC 43099]ELY23019.1 hypothetical protein C500_21185 [Natrialba magadii ATCC 43099]QBJ01196.1 uncharacterized protein PhiCh1_070 [Natrialba phage PhiCh1]
MIDNYEDRNREQTLNAAGDFSGDRLEEFLEYEREHKNRKTVIEPLERELLTVTTTGRNYVAGLWFDSMSEEKVVRRTTRVEQAIEREELREVD